MSGQNHKMKSDRKKSSSSPPTYTQPFFTYRTLDMKATDEKEIRCNPKVYEVGRVHKSMKNG